MKGAVPLLLLLGVFAVYVAFSPGWIWSMGYTGEELTSGERLLTIVDAHRKGVEPPPMQWSRHGLLPVLLDVPFIVTAKLLHASVDFVASFSPILWTSAIVTILFLWLRRLASSGMSILLTLAAAFGTMLWPYAYIGLETKQSFLILSAGYWALNGKISSWLRVLLFAILCGLAISVKSTSITLVPAVVYLLYIQFRGAWRGRRQELLASLLVIGSIWVAAALGRAPYWKPSGGSMRNLTALVIDSPFAYFSNLVGLFGSPTKGLFVYAPILIFSLYAIPRALRARRSVTTFVLLAAGGLAMGVAMFRFPADELWGPRYLHPAIAPLILCIGIALPNLEWRSGAPIAALTAFGIAISFLGATYNYAMAQLAATAPAQNTAEWLVHDPVWNPIRLHQRLFGVWLDGGTAPVYWTPEHLWVWAPPPDAKPWKPVNLRDFCQPQAAILRDWHVAQRLPVFHMAMLGIGLLSLVTAITKTVRAQERHEYELSPAVRSSRIYAP